jgi:hypothetical protein
MSDGALERCALRVDAAADFLPEKTAFDLEPVHSGEGAPLRIELRLFPDAPLAVSDTGLPMSAMALAVLEEHPSARITRTRGKWSLSEVPSLFSLELAPDAHGPDVIEIRIVIVLRDRRDAAQRSGSAWRAGSILATKSFAIRRPQAKSLLQVRNESFSEMGWDTKALWYVEYIDLSAPHEMEPDEVLRVYLNRDLDALQALWSPSATRHQGRGAVARMVRPMIAGEILASVATVVLGVAQRLKADGGPAFEIAENSLVRLLIDGLRRGVELEEARMLQTAADKPGELARKIQHLVGAGRAYGADALGALDQLTADN